MLHPSAGPRHSPYTTPGVVDPHQVNVAQAYQLLAHARRIGLRLRDFVGFGVLVPVWERCYKVSAGCVVVVVREPVSDPS